MQGSFSYHSGGGAWSIDPVSGVGVRIALTFEWVEAWPWMRSRAAPTSRRSCDQSRHAELRADHEGINGTWSILSRSRSSRASSRSYRRSSRRRRSDDVGPREGDDAVGPVSLAVLQRGARFSIHAAIPSRASCVAMSRSRYSVLDPRQSCEKRGAVEPAAERRRHGLVRQRERRPAVAREEVDETGAPPRRMTRPARPG